MKIKNIIILMVSCGIFSRAVAMKQNQIGPYEVVVECPVPTDSLPEDCRGWDILPDTTLNTYLFKFRDKKQELQVINCVHDKYAQNFIEGFNNKKANQETCDSNVRAIMGKLPDDALKALYDHVRPMAYYRFWNSVLFNAQDLGGRILVDAIEKKIRNPENQEALGIYKDTLNACIAALQKNQIDIPDAKKYEEAMALKEKDLGKYRVAKYTRRTIQLAASKE